MTTLKKTSRKAYGVPGKRQEAVYAARHGSKEKGKLRLILKRLIHIRKGH